MGPNGAVKVSLLKLMTGELVHPWMAWFAGIITSTLPNTTSTLQKLCHWTCLCWLFLDLKKKRIGWPSADLNLLARPKLCPWETFLLDRKVVLPLHCWPGGFPTFSCWMNPPIIWTKKPLTLLTDALNEWDRGLVLVSHDFRLINQVAKEIVITL